MLSLMPLEGIRRGRRSAAQLCVLLSGAWRPRTRSEVRCGWGLAVWLRTFSTLMGGGGSLWTREYAWYLN